VRHFTATKAQRDFHFVAVLQELIHVTHFDVVIIGICVWPEFDLFDLDDLLLFAGFSLAFLRLVFELTEIHDLTNGRSRVRRDFNKIEAGLVCHLHGTFGRDNAGVFAICADKTDFSSANTVVDAGACVALWWRVMGSAGYWTFP